MTTLTGQPQYARLGRQVQDAYVRKQRALDATNIANSDSITTKQGMLDYQSAVRARVLDALGPLPARGALNAQTTGTLVRTGYRVEKVLFESMPGWLVSADLYVPDAATPSTPAPGVVFACGHDTRAKWYYADAGQAMAKLGYVCLVFDMVGGGERLMIPSISAGVEHKQVGRQLNLAGWSMAGLQAWDGSRCVDYLLSRADVNPAQIGVHGHSGGGTQAMLITALDDRVAMSAPSCWLTSWHRQVENEQTTDHEQTPIGIPDISVDDFFLLHAPKPLVIIEKELDYWETRGAQELYARLDRAYGLLDAPPGTVALHIGPGEHQLDKNGREAAYRCFTLVTGLGVIEPARTEWETIADLNATATGSVLDEPGAINSVTLCTSVADAAAAARGTPTGETLKTRVRDFFGVPSGARGVPEYRIWELNYSWSVNYPRPRGCVYVVESDEGILAPLYYLTAVPHAAPLPVVTPGTRALLYISSDGADADLLAATRNPLVTSMLAAEPNAPFFALDVFGYGESAPVYNSSYPDEQYAQIADRLGEPHIGRGVWDILRCVDLLAAHGYTDIHIGGSAFGAPTAALAGLLDDRITKVSLRNGLTRWYAVTKAKPMEYFLPNRILPAHVLRYFDLPDVYAALAGKAFTNTDPWGAWRLNQNGEF